MRKRLLLVADALLVLALVALGQRLYTVWTEPPRPVSPRPPATVSADAPPNAAPAAPTNPRPPLSAFAVIAEQNLFSPTRTEQASTPAKPDAAPRTTAPKPRLWGVVLGATGGARAFLEDPRTRKVFPYGVGDTVAESRVEQIGDDRVVLRRGGEVFEVLLRDPSKPKPPPTPASPTPGAAPPAIPGTLPPRGAVTGQPTIPGHGPGLVPETPPTPAAPEAQPAPEPAPTLGLIPGQPQPFSPAAPASPARPRPPRTHQPRGS